MVLLLVSITDSKTMQQALIHASPSHTFHPRSISLDDFIDSRREVASPIKVQPKASFALFDLACSKHALGQITSKLEDKELA